jgi:ubiquinone/menaquinone biosynthesis C-methylase UbiE
MPLVPVECWTRLASVYDWQLFLERPALAAAVQLAAPRAHEHLLDVGTGTAGFLRELAKAQPLPARVVGLDASGAMLARAPRLPVGWELARADARSLPFHDSSFDVATATHFLHVLDEGTRQTVLAELARVLKPGGRLVTVTPFVSRSSLTRVLLAPLHRLALRSRGALAGLAPLDPRPGLIESGLFQVHDARAIARGYPSLCVLAEASTGGCGNTAAAESRLANAWSL